MVSYILFNTVNNILKFIFGENPAKINSVNKSIPPKCIFLKKSIQIGMKITEGRKDKVVGLNFNLCNYLKDFI